MTHEPRNFDQAAVRIMLSDRPQAEKARLLGAMSKEVTAAVHMRQPCPFCASDCKKEDNGLKPTDPDYSELCLDCGESWSPNL